jgi:hypothetical protein
LPKHFLLSGSGRCLCWTARHAPASGTARNDCRRKRGRFSTLAPLALQRHEAGDCCCVLPSHHFASACLTRAGDLAGTAGDPAAGTAGAESFVSGLKCK